MNGFNFIFGTVVGGIIAASVYNDTARAAIRSALGQVGEEIRKQIEPPQKEKEHSDD